MSHPIEAVDSYARRAGDVIRIVLTLPGDLADEVGDGLTARRVWLRLARRDEEHTQAVRTPVEVTPGARPRLVAEVPAADVPPGTWRLSLRVGRGGPLLPLEARLLTTDTARQPLALLAGPRPSTRMAAPAPR